MLLNNCYYSFKIKRTTKSKATGCLYRREKLCAADTNESNSGAIRAQRAAQRFFFFFFFVIEKLRKCDEERAAANRPVAPGDFGLISHLKLMEEEVKMRIIDTQLPLTCLPIKLISFLSIHQLTALRGRLFARGKSTSHRVVFE